MKCVGGKIKKDSVDLIPSPSVKIQIMGGKVVGKTLLDVIYKRLDTKKIAVNARQCFTFMPQANFPTYNLNFY